MITLAALAIGAGSFLAKTLSSYYAKKKLDKIFESTESFETELKIVINNSLDEYEERYKTPDTDGKYAFYKSQSVINELLRFRIISDTYDFNDLIKVIEEDKRLIPPTTKQLEYFFEVFANNISQSERLRHLEIAENFQTEIYKISDKIDELKSIVKDAISEINTALKDEWKIQLKLYQTLIEDFKPTTALQMLINIEDRFNIAEDKPSDKIYSKLFYLKALCFDLLKESQNARLEYIKAYKKDTSNIDYKRNAANSYFNLGQIVDAKQLASEILIEQDYDPLSNFINISNENTDEFINALDKLPSFIKEDFTFKRLTYYNLIQKETISEDSPINLYLNSIRSSFAKKEISTVSYSNFYEIIFRIEFAFNNFIRNNNIDFSTYPDKSLPEIEFLFNSTRLVLTAIKSSEIRDLYPQINFLYHYTDLILNETSDSLSAMKQLLDEGDIKDPNYVLILANCFQLKGQIDTAIEIVESSKLKYDELLFFKAFCYIRNADEKYFKSFEDYFVTVSEVKIYQVYRLFDYLVNSKKVNRIEQIDLDSIIQKNYESEKHKIIILHTIELLKTGKTYSKEFLTFLIENKAEFDVQILSYCAFCLVLINDFESAISTYNLYLDKDSQSQDLWYYIHALYDSKLHNEELLNLLKKWRLNFKKSPELLVIEINLRIAIADWQEVIDIADNIRELKPYDEDFYTVHLNALNQLDKKDEISDLVPILFTISVKNEINALNIFNVLFLNRFYTEAFEFIYPFAIDKLNTKIRAHYITGTINFPEHNNFFIQFDTVNEDSFVKYELDGKVDIIEIKNESRNLIVKELIGAKTGDKIKVKRPMSDVLDDVIVIRIMNKYLALFEDILLQAENPHSGLPLQQFKFHDMSPEALTDFFVKNFGSSGTDRKKYLEDSYQQYLKNKLPFTIFAINCTDSNYLKAYYYLANKEKGFLVCPLSIQNPNIDLSKKIIVDFTSLLSLFEISEQQKISFDNKFIIPKTLVDWLKTESKKDETQPQSEMSIDITREGVRPYFFSKDYKENQLKFYKNLLQWITANCEIVVVESKLDYLRSNEEKEDNIKNELNIVLDIIHLLLSPENILISDDQIFFNTVQPNIFSTEMFLKSKFEKIEEINSFFLMKGYIGLTLNKETLKQEFCKKKDGEENSYSECLKNIELAAQYSPVYTIKQVVDFLKETHTENIFIENLEKDTKEVFKFLMKGFNDIKPFMYLQLTIQTECKLLSDLSEQLLQILSDTIEQEYGDETNQ